MSRKVHNLEINEAEFRSQFDKAVQQGTERLDRPKARTVRYTKSSRRLVVEMENGATLIVPIVLIQGLQTSDPVALSDFELVAAGTQIHWHRLDVQFYVEDLLRGIFGSPKWMKSVKEHLSEIGRKGGSRKSEAKTASSRENGKKGGRPAKRVA